MQAFIKQLKNKMKTAVIYPITKTKAIYDDDNNRLDHILDGMKGGAGVDLTLAEYEALEETKETDNKNYFVTDESDSLQNAAYVVYDQETGKSVGAALDEIYARGGAEGVSDEEIDEVLATIE